MLRFIFPVYPLIFHKPPFQYIPCYGLSSPSGSLSLSTLISIHPMLRFIDFVLCIINRTSDISIHPMLRFIVVPSAPTPTIVPDFNTSHVTVYPWRCWHEIRNYQISIHPMLRFIIHMKSGTPRVSWFQYIPCYGLSRQNFRTRWKRFNFNTSHVTVYPVFLISAAAIKYISIHPMLRFIRFHQAFFLSFS